VKVTSSDTGGLVLLVQGAVHPREIIRADTTGSPQVPRRSCRWRACDSHPQRDPPPDCDEGLLGLRGSGDTLTTLLVTLAHVLPSAH